MEWCVNYKCTKDWCDIFLMFLSMRARSKYTLFLILHSERMSKVPVMQSEPIKLFKYVFFGKSVRKAIPYWTLSGISLKSIFFGGMWNKVFYPTQSINFYKYVVAKIYVCYII